MNLTPTAPLDADFVLDAALYVTGTLTSEQLAAKHGGDELAVLERLGDEATARAVETRVVEITQNGKLVQAESKALLRRALQQLDKYLDSDSISASTVVRIADLAHRVSGLATPPRDAMTEDKPRFTVNIILGDSNDMTSKVIDVQGVIDV